MNIKYNVLHGILFYVHWYICLDGAIHGKPYYGVISAAVILLLHFFVTKDRLQELVLITAMTLLGAVTDTLFMYGGLLKFAGPNIFLPSLAPAWTLAMHAVFGSSISHSLSYLDRHWLFAAVLGAAGGGFTYLVGQKAGAVEFLISTNQAVGIIAAVWFFYVPFVFRLRKWIFMRLEPQVF